MRPGESLPVTITFGSDLITDLTANGVKLSGTVYVGKQPFFRYDIDNTVTEKEILAVVDPGNKNIARFTITADMSSKFPNYASDINLFVKLTKANGDVDEKTINIEPLIPIEI